MTHTERVLTLDEMKRLPFKVDERYRPRLNTIKVGMTFLHIQEGKFKRFICERITQSRATCKPMWKSKVTLVDKKGKERTFYRSPNTELNLAANATVITYLEPKPSREDGKDE